MPHARRSGARSASTPPRFSDRPREHTVGRRARPPSGDPLIDTHAPSSNGSGITLAFFTAAITVSAALLFVVQPMVGKMILPQGGGSPQVWITALVFFQSALLAGYAYAHYSVRWLGPRRQIFLHAVVLLLPALVLPIALPELPALEGAPPSLWILALLTVGVGAPFFVVASASPLLQSWFASTRHMSAGDPYFLYASSNAGSLVGLLVYPFVVEPLLPLSTQSTAWALGYALFVVLAAGCAMAALRSGKAGFARTGPTTEVKANGEATPTALPEHPEPAPGDRAFWLAASAIPSALLMGVTHFITSRVAPVPLLWVLPLALYLITFIVAFSRFRTVSTERVSRLLAILGVFLALALLARLGDPIWLIVILHLAVLTVGALLCHQRLADRRPDPRHLTEFYLLISLGGVLGGAFSALIAPVAFNDIAEYPIAVALAALLRLPMRGTRTRGDEGEAPSEASVPLRTRALDFALPAALGVYMLVGDRFVAPMESVPDGVVVVVLAFVPSILVFTFAPRPLRYVLGLSLLFFFAQSGQMYRGNVLHQERTFFGIHRVVTDPDESLTMLYHGATAHGIQSRDPGREDEPLAYYHRSGPAGSMVAALAEQPDRRDIALVGVGTGALAALAGPHQHLTLYEIDAEVIEIAENPRYFTFLEESPASYETVIGDGRIQLAESERRFDLIVLDAFTGGSIPVHLLTREAVELYLDRLRPGGILLFHVSNRHLALAPVLATHARDLELFAYERVDARTDLEEGIFGSHWVTLVRRPEALEGVPDTGWRELRAAAGARAWTDDFSNLLTVQRWF
ncbi:MAG: fused MFS/spermidine synthase [Gemmatimonadota bacterium]|nr:fused MFS/spermidine synthase [Gemmatimonadota bacterium]